MLVASTGEAPTGTSTWCSLPCAVIVAAVWPPRSISGVDPSNVTSDPDGSATSCAFAAAPAVPSNTHAVIAVLLEVAMTLVSPIVVGYRPADPDGAPLPRHTVRPERVSMPRRLFPSAPVTTTSCAPVATAVLRSSTSLAHAADCPYPAGTGTGMFAPCRGADHAVATGSGWWVSLNVSAPARAIATTAPPAIAAVSVFRVSRVRFAGVSTSSSTG